MRQPHPFRLLVCGLVTAASLFACASPEKANTDDGHGFAVLATDGGLGITDGSTFEKLTEFDAEEGSSNGGLVWLDARTAIVLSNGIVGRVTTEGVLRSAPCRDCFGLAAQDGHVFTARTNYRPGDGFDIVALDLNLREISSIAATRLIERASREQLVENSGPPRMVAVTPSGIYLTHVSRNGGARHGPSILAKYDWHGDLVDHLLLDGLVFDVSVSPDLHYAGFVAGGSGGACRTTANVRVVDLADMRSLDTAPDVPGDIGPGGATWFTAEHLRWQGGRLEATGQVHHLARDEDCDDDPQSWTRVYDPAEQQFSDAPSVGAHTLRVIGPSCADQIGYAPDRERSVVVVDDGDFSPLVSDAEILGVSSGGLQC